MTMQTIRPSPEQLARQPFDVLVIGGGITGVAILLEAARQGHRALLIEQQDFAWGTSSRSSKMVHGGLRYLAQGDLRLTRHSLRERERLLRELPDLVVRQSWLFPVRKGMFPGRWPLKVALWTYDFLAGIRDHHWLSKTALQKQVPDLNDEGLVGAMSYSDALTDDSRLVMRVLHEAWAHGAQACNYMVAEKIERRGQEFEVSARDRVSDTPVRIRTRHVINATGAWADRLSGAAPRVRPQRGSHLFVTHERLPVNRCLTLLHQDDRRPIFVFPWEGATCIGTTDLDHRADLDREPFCTAEETDYLLRLVNHQFPQARLTPGDIISSMAGVRPIIASGRGRDPSKERRDHAVWRADGIVSVSGGKLTTFRLIALDALRTAGLLNAAEHARRSTSRRPMFGCATPPPTVLESPLSSLPAGVALDDILDWVLEREMVVHLDDLMLRRTRLGNLLVAGGEAVMEQVRQACARHLGWGEDRWLEELNRYHETLKHAYSPMPASASAGI